MNNLERTMPLSKLLTSRVVVQVTPHYERPQQPAHRLRRLSRKGERNGNRIVITKWAASQ
eukprot:7284959-Pyramimonas_sp.AAC.1